MPLLSSKTNALQPLSRQALPKDVPIAVVIPNDNINWPTVVDSAVQNNPPHITTVPAISNFRAPNLSNNDPNITFPKYMTQMHTEHPRRCRFTNMFQLMACDITLNGTKLVMPNQQLVP